MIVFFSLPWVKWYCREYSDYVVDDPSFYLDDCTTSITVDGDYYSIVTTVPQREMQRFATLLDTAWRPLDSYFVGEVRLPNGEYYRPSLSFFDLMVYEWHTDGEPYVVHWQTSTERPQGLKRWYLHLDYALSKFEAHYLGWPVVASEIIHFFLRILCCCVLFDLLVKLLCVRLGIVERLPSKTVAKGMFVFLAIIMGVVLDLSIVDTLFYKYQELQFVTENYQATWFESLILQFTELTGNNIHNGIALLVTVVTFTTIFLLAIFVGAMQQAIIETRTELRQNS